MAESKVTSRYARSLVDLALEKGVLEEVNKDMHLFHDTLKANPQLKAVLANPVIDGSDKKGILRKLFGGKVNALSLSFYEIMISKGRDALLYDTSRQFFEQYNALKGIVKASITSAAGLTDQQLKQVREIVGEIVPGEVQLENRIDPSLIGGFVLKIGDKQYDTSISRKLRGLKQELTSRFYESKI